LRSRRVFAAFPDPAFPDPSHSSPKDDIMVITTAHLSPLLSIIAGIAILLVPRLLNYIVAIYLIIIGVIGLGFVHI
jgi:Protein of unknown function (DUF3096)